MKNHILFIPCLIIGVIVILTSCSKPYNRLENKTWEGQVYRTADDKLLSDVRLKMTSDTLFIYANAIFGAGNDTLILQNYESKDSVFTYKSIYGTVFSFSYVYRQNGKTENLYFIGNDFYLALGPATIDIKEPDALVFYMNIPVPQEAYMYLDGTYEGEMEMENTASDLVLAGMGGATVKMEFLEGFKVKIYLKSLFMDMFSGASGPNYEICCYTISGNKIHLIHTNKSKLKTIEVRNSGETLVYSNNNLNFALHKIY